MGAIVDVVNAIQHGYGWAVVAFGFAWLMWQVYAPKILDKETALSPVVEMPEKVEEVRDTQSNLQEDVEEMGEKVDRLSETQDRLIDVSIAQSKVLNGHKDEVKMNAIEVENKLLGEQSESPDDYLVSDDD